MAFTFSPDHVDRAREAAAASLAEGGVPIGAALVVDGELVAVGHNQRVQHGDPTAHGEIDCLRNAGRMRSYADAVMITTLAPCAMCTGAIIQFGIRRVVVGEAQTFSGELGLLRSRGVDVVVLDDPACRDLMEQFQQRYPEVWAEDIGEVL
ncbi:tRNA-specific adenosine deaminase [Tersicoccus phoenicis]|uniref:tRNA-specific adenosine deaminase n=1 Tax=Tersicoccus phoenicis TaxID=554083 RepID=A0A1R1LGK5_9MICC|nr:nucleoside deaminase [Tersicoccus phoenicis]OMH26678.1 tRNA-specific adenosine deaminase [Tersicoccus phoenicis]